MWFHVAQANEYLVITGVGIDDVKVAKKSWVWPGQNLSRFNLTPFSYEIDLHAMSIEKLEFKIPAVFTIGPEDKQESLCKYARLLTIDARNLEELVLGIVEGETRVIAASLTIEEIFKDRKLFKEVSFV
jgi:flotillin